MAMARGPVFPGLARPRHLRHVVDETGKWAVDLNDRSRVMRAARALVLGANQRHRARACDRRCRSVTNRGYASGPLYRSNGGRDAPDSPCRLCRRASIPRLAKVSDRSLFTLRGIFADLRCPSMPLRSRHSLRSIYPVSALLLCIMSDVRRPPGRRRDLL